MTATRGQQNSTNQIFIYILLLITTSLWGSAFVFSKIAENSVPPAAAACLRFGIGTIVSFIMLFTLRARSKNKNQIRRFPKGKFLRILLLGLIGVFAYNWLFFMALSYSPAADGSMIIPSLSPAITVLLSAIFLHERLRKNQALGLVCTLIGAAIFFFAMALTKQANGHHGIGDVLFLGSAILWATYTLLGKNVLQAMDPLLTTSYAMLTGAVALGIVAAPSLVRIHWASLGGDFWLDQAFLGIFPSALANWFYYVGVRTIGPPRASVFMYFVPVSGLILSAIFLHEIFSVIQFIGAIVMILGVWMVNRRSRPVPSQTPAGDVQQTGHP